MPEPRDPVISTPPGAPLTSLPAELSAFAAALADRYAIERELGRGGMATVYLARDVRHDRLVALKVLNPELGAVLGAERFLGEIRVTANLRHPNLLPLFDSGEVEGLLFYVMPFVDGESLRHRLDREKQLPVDEAVRMATAVAQALDSAHRHGVIHRDLKPENILLQDDQPLIADFGIALAVSNAGGQRITQTGLSLGTPAYMSPEQATGDRVIDGRTDIYSLGAVLYEMLTGEPPHSGATAQAIIARVLTEPPRNIRLTRPAVPEYIDAAIERALEKLPADRWSTAREFGEALAGVRSVTGHGTLATRGARARRDGRRLVTRERVTWALVAIVLAALSLRGWVRPASSSRSVVRFAIEPLDHTLVIAAPVASPDGSRIVYVGSDSAGTTQLFARALDQSEGRPIPGTKGASQPFFSPDSRWLGFVAAGSLQRIPVDGGRAEHLSDVAEMWGATWGRNGDIVFAAGSRLMRVATTGGRPDTALRVDTQRWRAVRWPHFLPDGKTVLFTVYNALVQPELMALSLESGQVDSLGIHGQAPKFVDGFLLYTDRDGTQMAVRFDERKLRTSGAPRSIVDAVHVASAAGPVVPKLDASPTGLLVYLGGDSRARELVLVDRSGREQGLSTIAAPYTTPRFSPDGERIAVVINDPSRADPTPTQRNTGDVWIHDLRQGTLARVTFDSLSQYPEWSWDGRWITHARWRNDNWDLWRASADGAGALEPLVEAPLHQQTGIETRVGLVYRQDGQRTGPDILWRPTSATESTSLLQTAFAERSLAVTANGEWLAYVSNETGRDEVYARSLPGDGSKVQVSTRGGREPRWAANGSELFYRNGDSLIAVPVSYVGARLQLGQRALLFTEDFLTINANQAYYDVHPKGQQFVFVRDQSRATSRRLNVILNLFDRLRAETEQR